MPRRVLCVAEKNSVASEVARVMNGGRPPPSETTCAQYCRLYRLRATIPSLGPCDVAFTCVAGHMMELDFVGDARSWRRVPPDALFSAPVVKRVPDDKAPIERNLKQQARNSDVLILWLDCDREGENIAFEVVAACTAANPRLTVLRARFSSLSPPEIGRALATLGPPDAAASAAVDARQEIDLRVGAAFTRLQTLLLQDGYDWAAGGMDDDRPLLSYGPCQFPALGLIVQRAWEARAHVPEPFWWIHVSLRVPRGDGPGVGGATTTTTTSPTVTVPFKWRRGHVFDHAIAATLYEAAAASRTAVVTSVDARRAHREPPPPLCTLALQRAATRRNVLGLDGAEVMRLAEELYQGGFISYPRTETSEFAPDTDLAPIIAAHAAHPDWGAYAGRVASGELWRFPRSGGGNDRAHPPIHPTTKVAESGGWSAPKRRLYEFIVRSFLATCSRPAAGDETAVDVAVGVDWFSARGLVVRDRTWLDVYPYAGWGGNSPPLPPFVTGDRFTPAELELRSGHTAPPPRLAEGDLVGAMDAHGIGTDATIADHIKLLQTRRYAVKDPANGCFSPTPLGEALVSGYARAGLAGLWQPSLRGRIEAGIRAIADGDKDKASVLADAVRAFAVDFAAAKAAAGVLEGEVSRFFARRAGGAAAGDALGPCPGCGGTMALHAHEDGAYLACASGRLCGRTVALPRGTTAVATDARCGACSARVVDFTFRRAAIPAGFDARMSACALGCDRGLSGLLAACGDLRVPQLGGGGGGGAGPRPPRPPPAAPPRPTGRQRVTAGGGGTGRAPPPPASNGLPPCPRHGAPVLVFTTRNGANAGREFVKCSVDDDRENCLPFKWLDEWSGGGGGGGARCPPPPAPARGGRATSRAGGGGRGSWSTSSSSSRAGRGRGRGQGGGTSCGGGGRFVSAVGGAPAEGGCFKCGQPGHWASSCPNG